jgi:hypothetical protein
VLAELTAQNKDCLPAFEPPRIPHNILVILPSYSPGQFAKAQSRARCRSFRNPQIGRPPFSPLLTKICAWRQNELVLRLLEDIHEDA